MVAVVEEELLGLLVQEVQEAVVLEVLATATERVEQ